MFTPQQLESITFDKVHFGGYDMQSVDELLEPLLADYSVLYRENSTLKSKMRILVDALEKYRQNENSAKEALQAAQRTCDAMIREAEEKSLAMLHEAQANAQANVSAPVSQLAGEDARAAHRIHGAAVGRRFWRSWPNGKRKRPSRRSLPASLMRSQPRSLPRPSRRRTWPR